MRESYKSVRSTEGSPTASEIATSLPPKRETYDPTKTLSNVLQN